MTKASKVLMIFLIGNLFQTGAFASDLTQKALVHLQVQKKAILARQETLYKEQASLALKIEKLDRAGKYNKKSIDLSASYLKFQQRIEGLTEQIYKTNKMKKSILKAHNQSLEKDDSDQASEGKRKLQAYSEYALEFKPELSAKGLDEKYPVSIEDAAELHGFDLRHQNHSLPFTLQKKIDQLKQRGVVKTAQPAPPVITRKQVIPTVAKQSNVGFSDLASSLHELHQNIQGLSQKVAEINQLRKNYLNANATIQAKVQDETSSRRLPVIDVESTVKPNISPEENLKIEKVKLLDQRKSLVQRQLEIAPHGDIERLDFINNVQFFTLQKLIAALNKQMAKADHIKQSLEHANDMEHAANTYLQNGSLEKANYSREAKDAKQRALDFAKEYKAEMVAANLIKSYPMSFVEAYVHFQNDNSEFKSGIAK